MRLARVRKIGLQCDRGGVLVAGRSHDIVEHGAESVFRKPLPRGDAAHFHAAFRDGARLVQAQHVHARERLHAIEILREGLLAGQAHHAHAEYRAREGYQPGGDHPDDGAYRRDYDVVDVGRIAEKLGAEERHAHGHDDDAHHFDDQHERPPYLRGRFLEIFGAGGDLHHKVFRAYVFDAALRFPRHHKAPRNDVVADVLDDGVGLSRHEGLVHLAPPLHDDGVRAHLPARGKFHHVVEDDLFDGDLLQVAVAEDEGFGRGEQGEFVHGALGAQLLHYAHQRVENYEDEEAEVPDAVHAVVDKARQQHRQRHEDEVEKREDVGAQDLRHALGAYCLFAVDLAFRDARFDLRRAQPCGEKF